MLTVEENKAAIIEAEKTWYDIDDENEHVLCVYLITNCGWIS